MKRRVKKKLLDFKIKGKTSNTVEMKANVPKFMPAKAEGFMYRPNFMLGSMYWCFHKNDVDGWPSRPHGDQLGGRHKLNVFTREIYDRTTKKVVGYITKKEHNRLWSDKKFLGICKGYGVYTY